MRVVQLCCVGLCCVLQAVPAWAAWGITTPFANSSRTKTSGVAGQGAAEMAGSAVFKFGISDGWSINVENEMNVTVRQVQPGTPIFEWVADLAAPSGGWSLGQSNHTAAVQWGSNFLTQSATTSGHTVTN